MRTQRTAMLALPVAAALLLAACGGGDSSSGGSNPGAGGGKSDGAVSVFGTQPENPLIPSNTNEQGGAKVVDNIFTGLETLDPKTSEPVLAHAASIDSSDAQNFDIKLKDGWKFTDGTPVTAKSYVDAWNWGAYAPNGALNSSFFAEIEGYDAVNPPAGADGNAPKPTAKELSGLKVVGDNEFTVKLTAPFSPWKQKVAYQAFDPLPESFFADPKAFGRKPVGNGAFKFVSWDDNQQIVLTRNDDYQGEKPKIKDVTIKLYQDSDGAYADLRDSNLDFMDTLPVAALRGEVYKNDLPNRALEKDATIVDSINFPLYDKNYQNVDLRHAISMAINRAEITKVIYNNTRTPSTSYSSPAVAGYEPGTCGEYCTYDPAKAKAMFEKAGGFPGGTLTLSYNADGDHKAWTEAACNNISKALGVPCNATPVPTFADFRKGINSKAETGMFRSGWIYDFPNLSNGLQPLYATNGSANDSGYKNPAFDKALSEAGQITDEKEANTAYVDAEKMLAPDMPAIPLWSRKLVGGYSDKLQNVQYNAQGELDLLTVTTLELTSAASRLHPSRGGAGSSLSLRPVRPPRPPPRRGVCSSTSLSAPKHGRPSGSLRHSTASADDPGVHRHDVRHLRPGVCGTW